MNNISKIGSSLLVLSLIACGNGNFIDIAANKNSCEVAKATVRGKVTEVINLQGGPISAKVSFSSPDAAKEWLKRHQCECDEILKLPAVEKYSRGR